MYKTDPLSNGCAAECAVGGMAILEIYLPGGPGYDVADAVLVLVEGIPRQFCLAFTITHE